MLRRHIALGAWVVTVTTALTVGVVAMWSQATSTAPAVPAVPAETPVMTAAPPPTSSPSPSPARKPARQVRTEVSRALDRYLDGRSGELSLSIRDLSTGFSYTYAPKVRTATASIVKVDILVALLLEAQRAHRDLTAGERSLAAQMIKFSDNKAADSLWYDIGGASALAAANRRLHLRDTSPNPVWGATTTSAADQVRILTALTSAHGPLTAAHRRYVLDLMEDVTTEQAWGVSAAAGKGDSVALKNGWLPRPVDGGRWTINSIGRVRGTHHDYLIAVLSRRNLSMGAGIEAAEHAVRLVTSALPQR